MKFQDESGNIINEYLQSNVNEVDIFGNVSGGEVPKEYLDIKVLKFVQVGNYAIRIHCSDGHSTGIYSWDYLKSLSNLK